MQTTRLERFAPLAGPAFLVLAVVTFALVGDTPSNDDSTAEVVSYWQENDGEQMAGAGLGGLAALLLVWFGGSLRQAIARDEGRDGRLAALAFAGTVIAAVGLLAFSGFAFVAAETAGDVPGEVTQTLSVLNNDFFFPLAGGIVLLLLASGLAFVRLAVLPRWLGWLSLGLAVLALTPAGFVAFLATIVWVAAVGIVLFLRGEGAPVAAGAAAGSSPTPTAP